jgi:hypothetical protein
MCTTILERMGKGMNSQEVLEHLIEILCINESTEEITHRMIYEEASKIDFFSVLSKDLAKRRYYVFDGRFEDIVINQIARIVKSDQVIDYEKLICSIEIELEKLVVPVIVILPLVFVRGADIKPITELKNSDYALFSLQNDHRFLKDGKSHLRKHIENNIYAKLLDDHILKTKDAHFFNYPIMTIKIFDIDVRVESESPLIVEGVYSLIRLIGITDKRVQRYWSWYFHNEAPSTYRVVYNEVGTSTNPPYNSGYGHSFRFMHSPILDVDFTLLYENLELLSERIDRLIETVFHDRSKLTEAKIQKMARWQNALLLFNEAYELASREKFDSALLLLLAMLESLFVNKGRRSKSILLKEGILSFFDNNGLDYPVYEIIEVMYRKRNKFVHEGIGFLSAKPYKSINEVDGLISGMDPIRLIDNYSDNIEFLNLKRLFLMCREILLLYEFN